MKIFGHTVLTCEAKWDAEGRHCELYRTPKGGWLLSWEDDDEADAQPITRKRAHKLLDLYRLPEAA